MTPEHQRPVEWQARHRRATVAAGPTQFQAQAPRMLALGPVRATLEEAHADADAMDRLFDLYPSHQWCAAAQASHVTARRTDHAPFAS